MRSWRCWAVTLAYRDEQSKDRRRTIPQPILVLHLRGDGLTRRRLLLALIALATALGLFGLAGGADAQQPASPRRIGVLLGSSLPESKEAQAFRQGLLDAGYADGRDVVIEWRSANGDFSQIPQLAVDLVRSQVDVIVVESTPAARALKRVTSTIPIVMAVVGDPVGSGLVASLGHPGGNVTGLSMMITELSAKRLQLLKEAIPRVARVAVLSNPDAPSHTRAVEDLKAAAPSLAIELTFVSARTPEAFGPAFSAMGRARAEALYVLPDAFFFSRRVTLLRLASKARLPAISVARQFAEAGALMSYGPNFGDPFRRSAGYVDKILKGAKPADLPIQQPTQFELVVNLKTAQGLGIAIPESILLQADEVIR
jgi:putative ABC transport system substrate-binding protein